MLQLRVANSNDVSSVEHILVSSRNELLPYARSPHTRQEIRTWVSKVLIPTGNVVVAHRNSEDVGVIATSVREGIGWIDQLYVLPDHLNQGVGTALLRYAQNHLPRPIHLWTFQQNQRALCFYEHHGFNAIKYTDGENNEEKCPDALYELN